MAPDPTMPAVRRKVRALLLGDRIDTSGLERTDVLSTAPLAFRAGKEGVVTVFRYGVVVLFNLAVLEEDEVLRGLRERIVRPITQREDETATIEIAPDKDEQILPGGPILLKSISPEHMLVIADALAKSVVLARDEREVASVIEVIEPFARQLAEKGRTPEGRHAILKHVGNALLVQHRVSGRVAVTDKPDVVWDRPDLDRLYARLEDEYELKERAEALSRKLAVISDTAEVLTDIIDTRPETRCCTISALPMILRMALRPATTRPWSASCRANGSTKSNTLATSRSSRASTTLFDNASAMTIKCSGVIVFSVIGPPGRIWSSLSGTISISADSSSEGATGRTSRSRRLRRIWSSSAAVSPMSTATPYRNSVTKPPLPYLKVRGAVETTPSCSRFEVSMRSLRSSARIRLRGLAEVMTGALASVVSVMPDICGSSGAIHQCCMAASLFN